MLHFFFLQSSRYPFDFTKVSIIEVASGEIAEKNTQEKRVAKLLNLRMAWYLQIVIKPSYYA